MSGHRIFFPLLLLVSISSCSLCGMQGNVVDGEQLSRGESGCQPQTLGALVQYAVPSQGERALLCERPVADEEPQMVGGACIGLARLQGFLPQQSRLGAAQATLQSFVASLVPQKYNQKMKCFTSECEVFSNTFVNRTGLYNWDFSRTTWDGSFFSGNHMSGLWCIGASMKHVVMGFENPVIITYSNFSSVDFDHAAFLPRSQITACMFMGAHFKHALLRGAFFKRSDFRNADFSDAHLKEVLFIGSDFQGACFKNASFESCSLGKREEDLKPCNLCGADFTDAFFDETTMRLLTHAKVNKQTTWIDGKPMTAQEAAAFGMEFIEVAVQD